MGSTIGMIFEISGDSVLHLTSNIGATWARTNLPAPVTAGPYDAANRTASFGGQAITYDNNGNVTSFGADTYNWNARNQLASMTGASFVYDGLGRRQKKTIGAARTEFLYDWFDAVQETDGAAVTANILGGLYVDEIFTRTDGDGARHFLTDDLGSNLALTDPTGAIQTEYTYEPFGRTTASGAASTNSYQFTGRENDGTGLYYYRFRYYHPQLQRFISEDPLQFDGGDYNLYAYVRNNSINGTDPSGLQPNFPPSGVPGGLPGGPPLPVPNPSKLLDFFTSVVALEAAALLSREIAHKVEDFEHTIDCGKQVPVIICISKRRPLGSVIVAEAVLVPTGEYVCTKYIAWGRKNCCSFPR